MPTISVYEQCPVYETRSFRLRLVRLEDAPALLACYGDKQTVARLNADSCTSDFYYPTVEAMADCIRFWLREYAQRRYVRFAILPKSGDAVGTVEVFGGAFGVLRLDIAASYDREAYIEELLRLAVLRFIWDFQIASLKIKVANTPERIPLLKRYGFVPSQTFRPGLGYYERPVVKFFDAAKGVAFCGLACCVCSENPGCAGCKNGGCRQHTSCENYRCCNAKGLAGCWACKEFPCGSAMLAKLRVRTFGAYIARYGPQQLLRALQNNEARGVLYHYPGQLVGDYDLPASEEELLWLIDRGL